MELSVVASLYRSAPHLPDFHRRMSAAARQLTNDYEIILVDDGSPDASLDIALHLLAEDSHLRIVDLARNFGHHKAMMTGLAYARGRLVFLIDSDLEEEPEILPDFLHALKTTRADVVYGVQERRKGRRIEQWSGELFCTLHNWLSGVKVPHHALTARLMTRRYVRSLLRHREREVSLLGLWTITGYQQVPLRVRKHPAGASAYDLRRKLSILVDSTTSFSARPLVFVFYLGLLIMLVSTLAAGTLIIRRLFFGVLLEGWPSLIVSIWMLGGMTIFCLGILGIYLSKIFSETKRRPYTVVRQVHQHPAVARHEH
jgi:putative glycosyltransferase